MLSIAQLTHRTLLIKSIYSDLKIEVHQRSETTSTSVVRASWSFVHNLHYNMEKQPSRKRSFSEKWRLSSPIRSAQHAPKSFGLYNLAEDFYFAVPMLRCSTEINGRQEAQYVRVGTTYVHFKDGQPLRQVEMHQARSLTYQCGM